VYYRRRPSTGSCTSASFGKSSHIGTCQATISYRLPSGFSFSSLYTTFAGTCINVGVQTPHCVRSPIYLYTCHNHRVRSPISLNNPRPPLRPFAHTDTHPHRICSPVCLYNTLSQPRPFVHSAIWMAVKWSKHRQTRSPGKLD